MTYFEKLYGMRINYHKSDITSINLDEEIEDYAKIFCCKIGKFPFVYLGVPLQYEKHRKEDIQSVVDKIMKNISRWKGRLLSYGARLVLLKACLASILVYLMSIIKFPKWAIKAINTQMANFYYSDQEDRGGLGVLDLRNLNLCLLASWVQRYCHGENKVWNNVIHSKYHLVPNIFSSSPRNASPFWKGVIWAADAAKMGMDGE
jgi:hypothetical protein